VNEDQAIDEVDVAQSTCIVIHEEYDWASENEPIVKDDFLLSVSPLLFLDIVGEFVISDFPCVNPSTDESTSNHSQNSLDVSTSFDSGEDKLFIEHPLDFSSVFVETQRVNILDSHLPLSVIPKIMRMLTNILNFLIMVIMISVLLHLIMMSIHFLLICQRHCYLIIYLSTKCKPCRLSRYFSLS